MANDASVWLKPRYRKHNYFFVWPFLTETKFKMAAIAAILDKIRRPFCIGFFSSMVQIHPMSFKWIGASVLLLLNGNQIQDGCHGGHIGKVKTQIFNNVLLLHGPNPPYEFQMDRCKCSPFIERKPNARWLPWTCFIMWACEPTY